MRFPVADFGPRYVDIRYRQEAEIRHAPGSKLGRTLVLGLFASNRKMGCSAQGAAPAGAAPRLWLQ
ncbi:MAG: hypothetical protein ABJC90_11970 [Roseobacter sp.]